MEYTKSSLQADLSNQLTYIPDDIKLSVRPKRLPYIILTIQALGLLAAITGIATGNEKFFYWHLINAVLISASMFVNIYSYIKTFIVVNKRSFVSDAITANADSLFVFEQLKEQNNVFGSMINNK